jgi:hypothetical protein
MIANRRRTAQRGSALLVVLVFAAVIAIMLYRELPVATFEAQRQKEQLLMDRGNEYKRAVQLYVRKIQNFPPSLDALENTNRMRFLRFRYVDPYTGKDDWRLLHAGPGGIITDSKIKSTGSSLTGASGSTAATLGTGSSVTNPFANSFDGANPNGQQGIAANVFPQRPPAIAAGAAANGGGSAGNDAFAAMAAAGQANLPPSAGGDAGNAQITIPPPPGPIPSSASLPASDGQSNMQALLNNQNPIPVSQNSSVVNTANQTTSPTSSSGLGTMSGTTVGSGIAGVASKSTGKTIKVFNDQTDRSLWEFVYDMQKEATANAQGALGTGTNSTNGNGGNSTTSTGATSGSTQTGSTTLPQNQ